MTDQRAELTWTDGVPVSGIYDDPYFSLEDGVAETEYVFLSGNDLPARLVPGFQIAELGFGTGLNLLVALRAARNAGALPLKFTSFEAHPISHTDMERALAAFPDVVDDAAWLVSCWSKGAEFSTEEVEVSVILGDAAGTLPRWSGMADAWFLDGFAPSKNPGLWTPDLLHEVARHTHPGGTAATYTAAGHVRRALAEAGFTVKRKPGYGRKRHMTIARLDG